MDSTTLNTAVTVISTFVTLFSLFGKPVYVKIKDTGWFSITDLSNIEQLAENPENEKLQGKVEGMLETRIASEDGFEDKLKGLITELNDLEAQGFFKRNLQIGDDNYNDQSGGEGSKDNYQYGDGNKNKQ